MASSMSEQGMVLVMGVTGAGKSYFINQLKEGAVIEGASMDSCTVDCEIVETRIGDTSVAVVDCPGFDDSFRSDAEILSIISELVITQYHIGMKLCGIIFLHRITDNKFQGSTRGVLSLFRQLVGDDALGNVVLATTQWSRVSTTDMPAAINREQELRDKYWSEMLEADSTTCRFKGDKASAEGIIAQLLGKNNMVLQLQKELIQEKRSLGKTEAGLLLRPKMDRRMKEDRAELARLKGDLGKEGLNNTRRLRLQREISEAKARISRGELDETRFGKKVGLDLKAKLADVDWQKGLRIAFSVLSFTITLINVLVGGV